MQRVLVIGSGGAGKSTFAQALAAATHLPLVHLDGLHWRPAWMRTDPGDRDEVVRGLVAADRWVIDGNDGGTIALRIARADTVVFLDTRRLTCLRRVAMRALPGRRVDVAPGCRQRLTWEFLCWVWSYPRTRRPGVLAELAEFERQGGRSIVLRGRAEVARFLTTLAPR